MPITKWTDAQLNTIASKYSTLKELRENEDGAYQAIKKRKLPCLSHLERTNQWTPKELISIASNYPTRVALKEANTKAYRAIMRLNLQEEAYGHIEVSGLIKWTEEALQQEIVKYNTVAEFRKNSINAYDTIKRRGLMGKLLGHFPSWREVKRKDKVVPIDDNLTGIYILYSKDEIVYVGKSSHCIYQRLLKHLTPGNIEYKEVTKVEVFQIANKANTDVAEIYLINMYKPPLNKDCNSSDVLTIQIESLSDIIDKYHSFEVKDNKCTKYN